MNYLTEYPRPQFQRDSYISLNGIWQYKISKSDAIPEDFDAKLVYFSFFGKMTCLDKNNTKKVRANPKK